MVEIKCHLRELGCISEHKALWPHHTEECVNTRGKAEDRGSFNPCDCKFKKINQRARDSRDYHSYEPTLRDIAGLYER